MDRPDLAWKLVASRYPAAFLRLFFPDIAEMIDWTRPHYLPDNELLPAPGSSQHGAQHPDVTILAESHDGRELCIHIEIQCSRQANFEERMARYHTGLRERFGRPVISLALLADPGLHWRPERFDADEAGCSLSVTFRIAKLQDFRDQRTQLAAANNPAAFTALVHLHASTTRRNPAQRELAKQQLARLLHEKRWHIDELFTLQAVLDLLMPLPLKWQRRLPMDIDDLLRLQPSLPKNSLNYMLAENIRRTLAREGAKVRQSAAAEGHAAGHAEGHASGRAEGLAEGRAKGWQQGREEFLVALLEGRFGALPPGVRQRISQASQEQMEALGLAVIEAPSLREALRKAGLDA